MEALFDRDLDTEGEAMGEIGSRAGVGGEEGSGVAAVEFAPGTAGLGNDTGSTVGLAGKRTGETVRAAERLMEVRGRG